MARPEELKAAASTIRPGSLEEAKSAIVNLGEEFLTRLIMLESGLDRVETSREVVRFSRALALYQLAHLPLKPRTCPFCVQHSEGNCCEGCGYASTHGGRCDADTSAFGQLIESVYELAGKIHSLQDEPAAFIDLAEARGRLRESIARSSASTELLLNEVPLASTTRLMEIKAEYLDRILQDIPIELMNSQETERLRRNVLEKVGRYW